MFPTLLLHHRHILASAASCLFILKINENGVGSVWCNCMVLFLRSQLYILDTNRDDLFIVMKFSKYILLLINIEIKGNYEAIINLRNNDHFITQ